MKNFKNKTTVLQLMFSHHRSSFGSSRNAPQREAETRHERPRGRLELPDGAKSFAFCS